MTFQADKERGERVELLAAEYFTSRGWTADKIPAARQRKGAGDLRLFCPRTLLVAELEIKASFGDGPNCLIELSTGGAEPHLSGALGSRADLILFYRDATGLGCLFRLRELEERWGEWVRAFRPIKVRDHGARSWRHCIPVPWSELVRAGTTIHLQPLEAPP